MKRYLVWQGETYYSSGPVADLVGSFDSLDEALRAASQDRWARDEVDWQPPYDWLRILDTESGEWVKKCGCIYQDPDTDSERMPSDDA